MTDLVLHAGERLLPAMSLQQVADRRNQLIDFAQRAMTAGTDYGKIPGSDKDVLLKPGAEKLCTLFGLAPSFDLMSCVEDFDRPLFHYRYKCTLYRDGQMVSSGEGSCNSHEKKYRYRNSGRVCPECGKETIIKGKAEFGGGWICFAKKGGCGAKWPDRAPEIESQAIGQVENGDAADLVNTIMKMAQKRALVAAVLIATNASEMFTQDLEDMYIEGQFTVEQPERAPEPAAQAKGQPAAPLTPTGQQQRVKRIREMLRELHEAGGDTTHLDGVDYHLMTALELDGVEQDIAALINSARKKTYVEGIVKLHQRLFNLPNLPADDLEKYGQPLDELRRKLNAQSQGELLVEGKRLKALRDRLLAELDQANDGPPNPPERSHE